MQDDWRTAYLYTRLGIHMDSGYSYAAAMGMAQVDLLTFLSTAKRDDSTQKDHDEDREGTYR